MRHLTLDYIEKLVLAKPKPALRRPAPMPGKKWPTRVAWRIEVADRVLLQAQGQKKFVFVNWRKHEYIGKPSQYRALAARRFIQQVHSPSVIACMWQAEFDKQGLITYRLTDSTIPASLYFSTPMFTAYHPHSPETESPVEAFTKPLYLKYVGGMRMYSQKKKLPSEAVDAYYEWFHAQFKRRLRRPKSQPVATVGGEPFEQADPQQ